MTLAAKLRAPGWYRVAISQPLSFAFSIGLVAAVRALYGYDPVVDWTAITTVALIAMPLAFLVPKFGKGIMPATYKDDLSPDEIDALVKYLLDVGGGKGK